MAQTVGIITDDHLYVLVGGVKFNHITSCSLTLGAETIDVTSYDSNKWKDIQMGDKNWSVTLEAHYAMDATEGGDDAAADLIAGTSNTILVSSENSGDTTFSGTGYLTSLSLNSSKGSSTTVSVTFEGTGVLTVGVVI